MYGSLLTGRVTSDSGVVGAVQRDDPEHLQAILRDSHTCGYEDLAKAILVAADKGFEQCVRILLRKSHLQDIHDPNGFTPLHLAAKRGHANIVQVLLDSRCKINKATYRTRATALHWAATNGHGDCIDTLIAAGAEVDSQTMHGRTPLMLCVRSGFLDIAKSLIDAGAQVNKCDMERTTALHLAAEEGHLPCVNLLLHHGAKINSQKKKGDTPLLLAVKRGQISVVVRLLEQPDISPTPSSEGLSAVHWAAQGGHNDCLRHVLPYHASPDLQTEDTYYGPHFVVNAGVTPLMLACAFGHVDCASLLLERGADTEIADAEGMTALLCAIRQDHEVCAALLLAAGADPDHCQADTTLDDPELEEIDRSRDDEDLEGSENAAAGDRNDSCREMSPLFLSIERGSMRCFLALLQSGCCLTRVFMGSHGRLLGPLEFALCNNRPEMCQMLVSMGHQFSLSMTPAVEDGLAALLQEDEKTFELVVDHQRMPSLLSHQCRWRVLRQLPRRKMAVIEKLPVPEAMKLYLKLEDLKDIAYPHDES